MNRLIKSTLLAGALLALSACGFHLRGLSAPLTPLRQRAAIVAAGPIANFLLAIALCLLPSPIAFARCQPPRQHNQQQHCKQTLQCIQKCVKKKTNDW